MKITKNLKTETSPEQPVEPKQPEQPEIDYDKAMASLTEAIEKKVLNLVLTMMLRRN